MQISETKYILFDSTPCWVFRPVQTRCAFRLYIPHLDKYITYAGLFTDSELDYVLDMGEEWKESLGSFDWEDMAKLFLTNKNDKNHIKQLLEAEIEVCRNDLKKADNLQTQLDDIIYRKAKDEKWWREVLYTVYLDPIKEDREHIMKRNSFRIASLQDRIITGGITRRDIERAKKYPIRELMQFNRQGNAMCLWHTDKNPSLYYYANSNHVYCFSCNKSADAIDVFMKLRDNKNFVQAVKQLL